MNVTVRLFARARDLVGADSVPVELPESATIDDLRRQLVQEYAALESLSPHLLFSVGTDYVTEKTPISEGDELAAFPPVSGG